MRFYSGACSALRLPCTRLLAARASRQGPADAGGINGRGPLAGGKPFMHTLCIGGRDAFTPGVRQGYNLILLGSAK